MEAELDPRAKILPYKVRGVSRESQAQKAVHVLDADLRTHWSTATNTKDWLLLELEEPCLLSHIRIHNKSVLEWEISVGLKYKPDTFLKVRTRCDAPRRDIQYHIGYVPCRFVRISCLRGNPIGIFFVQLIGISVPALEPEFQPVVDYLLPQITSHKQDLQDLYLQLLQDITVKLLPFLPHLEGELSVSSDAMESNIRFLAMLAGPFYPILMVVRGRENLKNASSGIDQESVKSSQASVFTVSSNFQAPPRRSRSPVPSQQSIGHTLSFRPDVVLLLLKVAYKDDSLGVICRLVSRIFRKLAGSMPSVELVESVASTTGQIAAGTEDLGSSTEATVPLSQTDFSSLFGEEFKVIDNDGEELVGSAVLDISAVEEGLLNFLYACAPQPLLYRRLAEVKPDLPPVLPFIQAILPALRPVSIGQTNTEHVDECFSQWQVPLIQRAVTQVVSISTSAAYRPLLDACAGYLSSYSLAHEKSACVLIDLCAGPLAPWLSIVIAKVDLAIEIVEDLLGVIQAGHQSTARAWAALMYLMLALSGHMDDVLTQYKDVKHSLLFLIEMLEPFLIPAITPVKNTIAFGDVSTVLLEKQEQTCALALDLLHTAIGKPAVLPAFETEWRRGNVAPSVLFSILAPHVPLPPGIDLCKSVPEKSFEKVTSAVSHGSVDANATKVNSAILKNVSAEEDGTGKNNLAPDGVTKVDTIEDPSLLFAPTELRGISLQNFSNPFEGTSCDNQSVGHFGLKIDSKGGEAKDGPVGDILVLDAENSERYFNFQAEYLQLVNHQERELRASEFIRFAVELHSRTDMNLESHRAAIDALLLAAECHLNPFLMFHSTDCLQLMNKVMPTMQAFSNTNRSIGWGGNRRENKETESISFLEEERDKAVIHILLKAAEWDWEAMRNASEEILLIEGVPMNECNDSPCYIPISDKDALAEDATTLVRKHQILLCNFLVHQLQRERHNMYEVLLHGLLFLLYSATQLSSPPEHIVDAILRSAKRLNSSIVSLYNQMKEGNSIGSAMIHSIRRQWALLGRLVVVASGGGLAEDDNDFRTGVVSYYCRDVVPASAWMSRIAQFSSSPFPLVRYIGWKALSCFAKSQKNTGFLLASDMQQLSSLLSIFSDDMTSVAFLGQKRNREQQLQLATKLVSENSQVQLSMADGGEPDHVDKGGLVSVLYPELDLIFPKLRIHFSHFAGNMLEAVCLQLKAIPPTAVSDILSWFSELCYSPFSEFGSGLKENILQNGTVVKGFSLTNVRFMVLCLLEVIVSEHMEAIVPELPRLLDVIVSLCHSSFCDVHLLESVLNALKPLISYAVFLVGASECQLQDDPSAVTFEALCFGSVMDQLRAGPDSIENGGGQGSKGSLLLFLSGFILSDLSATRQKELLLLQLRWADFTVYSLPSSYYNYLHAFQKIVEACDLIVQGVLEEGGLSLPKEDVFCLTAGIKNLKSNDHHSCSFGSVTVPLDVNTEVLKELHTKEMKPVIINQYSILENALCNDSETRTLTPFALGGKYKDEEHDALTKNMKIKCKSEIEEFAKNLLALVHALGSSLEVAWKLHAQVAEKLAYKAAHCLMSTVLLISNYSKLVVSKNEEQVNVNKFDLEGKEGPTVWQTALEAVAQMVMTFQQDHCWQVAAAMMEFLLSLPESFNILQVLPSICLALQYQGNHAPRVSWRLLANKWLSIVVTRIPTVTQVALDQIHLSPTPLFQLFCSRLEHPEPEQRGGALQQLKKLVEQEELCKSTAMLSSLDECCHSEKWQTVDCFREKLSDSTFVSCIVVATWDKVASLAASESSLYLRRQAMELLLTFIPLAKHHQLQAFLHSVESILPVLTKPMYALKDGVITRLALSLLARACLYSSPMAIDAISPTVWTSLEILAKSKPGSIFIESERLVCLALLQLREYGEDAKQVVRDSLSRSEVTPQISPDFTAVRETVLEVLAQLNVVHLRAEACTDAAMQETKELEEAEIELELAKQERALQESVNVQGFQASSTSSSVASSAGLRTSVNQRLKELRMQILAEEHSTTRAEVAARRERQRIARHDRQLALEEATLREIELLHELERDRAAESEREIERQRILENERAKTRELQFALDLEAEKRNQKELQRELEQRESGVVRSRREFSSSVPGSRPRERYREREREGGRPGQDSRPSSSGGIGRDNGATSPATPTAGAGNVTTATSNMSTIVIGSSAINSRAYPDQSFTYSHSCDRSEDRGYDEILDGSGIIRDISEGSTYADIDSGTMIDSASTGGLVGSHRQGPRSSRPRQIVERRERDARREGKWERKQS